MTEILSDQPTIAHKLSYMQSVVKSPKNQTNAYQGWGYRRAEDILAALKDHMDIACYVLLSDEIWQVGDRYYVKATASFCYQNERISATSFAREPFDEKGKQLPQITASCATYARKNALCALFAIDGSMPEDDQKHGEVDARDNRKTGKDVAQKPKSVITPEQLFKLDDLMKLTKYDPNKLLSRYNIEKLSDMTVEMYEKSKQGLSDLYEKMCSQV